MGVGFGLLQCAAAALARVARSSSRRLMALTDMAVSWLGLTLDLRLHDALR